MCGNIEFQKVHLCSILFYFYLNLKSKIWTALDELSNIWKQEFFQTLAMSVKLYSCITWILAKYLEKKLEENYTRMLRAGLDNSWKQRHTKDQLFGHSHSIYKSSKMDEKVLISRHELISNNLLRTSTRGRTNKASLSLFSLSFSLSSLSLSLSRYIYVYIYISALWRQWMLSREPFTTDSRQGQMARARARERERERWEREREGRSQGNLRYQHDLMMMMIMISEILS